MGSTIFGTPYNTDKAKAWFEMFKAAIQSGKKVNIFYDTDYRFSFWICDNYGSSGTCGAFNEPYGERILRVSLQP
jgi:hypothetical protein